ENEKLIEELENKLTKAENFRAELEEELQIKSDELAEERSSAEIILNERDFSQKELESLRNSINSGRQETQTNLQREQNIKDQFNTLRELKKAADVELINLKAEYTELKTSFDNFKNDNFEMQRKHAELIDKFHRVEDEKEQYTDKFRVIKKKEHTAVIRVNQLNQEMQGTLDSSKEIERENESLKRKMDELNQQLTKEKDLNDEHTEKIEELTAKIGNMQQKLIEYKFQGKRISELELEIDDLKRRNEFLEAETKKFKTILGFGDIDINEQLKKKLVDNAVLNLSARFLQNGWQLEKSLSKPKDISAMKKITKSMERLAKPVDAMKIRLNLRTFFEELMVKIPGMIAEYEKLYNK
ncbi:MAG: hypothetical protein KAR20_27885, partial [Candidatus Heimdallarchaeota archaeon]|nr:hypothetical protein [Candidatus Heimdallarchaeota archaeon]